MANRLWTPVSFKLEKNVVELYFAITFGNTGAPTANSGQCKGLKSITRTSQGLFVLTLGNASQIDQYNRLLGFDVSFVLASGIPAAAFAHVVSFSAGVLTIQFEDADTPAATDPANTEVALIHLVLSNSKSS